MENFWKHIVPTASAICGVKPEHSRLKSYRNLSRNTDLLSELVTSLLIRGIQVGEMSKLGWLIGSVKYAIWAYSLYFLYLLVHSFSKILASFRPTLWFSSYACWANFDISGWPSSRIAYVHGAARLEVCLFRHIHRECYRRTVPSVADLFPTWFSLVNS
jgi:hypothetical protein